MSSENFLTTLIGRNATMVSLRLLLVQESQRGYSPFSNTYCSPLQLSCSYPTHLRGKKMEHGAWWLKGSQCNLHGTYLFPRTTLYLFTALLSLCIVLHITFLSVCDPHSRSTQHQYGAHFLNACFLEVFAGASQLMAASLEVFLLIDNQLAKKRRKCVLEVIERSLLVKKIKNKIVI